MKVCFVQAIPLVANKLIISLVFLVLLTLSLRTYEKRKSDMTEELFSATERALGSFASLLSSAIATNSEGGSSEPLRNSADKLACFVAPDVANDTACCAVPSMLLNPKRKESSSAGTLEEAAALKLAKPLTLRRGELKYLPKLLLQNLKDSFMVLVDARMRSSVLALVRQSRVQKEKALMKVLIGLIACSSNPISPTTVVTSFRALPVAERIPGGECVLPLVMEVVIDLKVLGSMVTVTFVAPGTIQGKSEPNATELLRKVEVVLDTVTLLHSMMKEARVAAKKAITLFSTIASQLLPPTAAAFDVMAQGPASADTSPEEQGSSELLETNAMPKKVESSTKLFDPEMPPPARKSPSWRSLGDFDSRSLASDFRDKKQNATWSTNQAGPSSQKGAGLMLLTAAASLKRRRGASDEQASDDQEDSKRPRAPIRSASIDPLERRTSSCPNLRTYPKPNSG
jgi:hypothetical protein